MRYYVQVEIFLLIFTARAIPLRSSLLAYPVKIANALAIPRTFRYTVEQ